MLIYTRLGDFFSGIYMVTATQQIATYRDFCPVCGGFETAAGKLSPYASAKSRKEILYSPVYFFVSVFFR